MGNLAWVRELVSMIHLAKFSGAPAARAEELVAQNRSRRRGHVGTHLAGGDEHCEGRGRVMIPFFAAHPCARLRVLARCADFDNVLDLDPGAAPCCAGA